MFVYQRAVAAEAPIVGAQQPAHPPRCTHTPLTLICHRRQSIFSRNPGREKCCLEANRHEFARITLRYFILRRAIAALFRASGIDVTAFCCEFLAHNMLNNKLCDKPPLQIIESSRSKFTTTGCAANTLKVCMFDGRGASHKGVPQVKERHTAVQYLWHLFTLKFSKVLRVQHDIFRLCTPFCEK